MFGTQLGWVWRQDVVYWLLASNVTVMAGNRRFDPFLLLILSAAGLGMVLPTDDRAESIVSWVTKFAIFVLFFAYGARLSAREAFSGLKNWRLHLTILACTYLVFPFFGLLVSKIPTTAINPLVIAGVIFLCVVPSTVQSSITFTSIAGGNVPGALVAATVSNLLGVVLTPVLVLLLLPGNSAAGDVGMGQFAAVSTQLLLPFILGQLSRPLTANFMSTHRKRLKWLDQGVIALVVYGAFASFRTSGTWRDLSWLDLGFIVLSTLVLLGFMLWFTWQLAGWLKFDRADQIAVLFCGTKKSLATGVPMASVIFASSALGVLVLPLMLFHQSQLIACSVIAPRLARATPNSDGGR